MSEKPSKISGEFDECGRKANEEKSTISAVTSSDSSLYRDLTEHARTSMRQFMTDTVSKGLSKIIKEFKILKANVDVKNHDSFDKNQAKNRYNNIYCYEESRVKLNWPPKYNSDYIHANWVKGITGVGKDIICTQGPLPETIDDFWRMIWQEKCAAIIMLCSVMENGDSKCILNETKKEKLCVRHILWNGWPDQDVPSSTTSALKLLVRTQSFSPIVVHCSAGVGRTGVVVAIDICLRTLLSGNTLDVLNVVKSIRCRRYMSCQTVFQYAYIYRAVLSFIVFKEVCSVGEIDPFLKQYEAMLSKQDKGRSKKIQAERMDLQKVISSPSKTKDETTKQV